MDGLLTNEMLDIVKWNDTKTKYSDNLCIHNKLEDAAIKFADNIALRSKDKNLSYSELNNAANNLAKVLIDRGVCVEDFVILYSDRSIEFMISVFAILKSGGVYVPVSSEIPLQRIEFILDDTKPKVILTTKALSANISSVYTVILIDDLLKPENLLPSNNISSGVSPNNLAYAIFTSGTTGRPKGVLIEHHSVFNRIEWMQKAYPITEKDVLIQKTPITFDVSIWELFWWSFEGASLVILEKEGEKNPEILANSVFENGVTVIHFVPSMFSTFIKYLEMMSPVNKISTLKWLFCSGEELYQNQVVNFYKIADNLKIYTTIINLYGPTEATVDVSYYTCNRDVDKIIPIGKPIDNTELYVRDKETNILPANQQGEIILCGVNLARGYLNRDELTKEKFFNLNVFGVIKKAYKTGDLGYYDSSGNIIYKGRLDTQVKLRGFRIELGEIENIILSFPLVSMCVCAVQNEKEETAHIVAFVVSKSNEKLVFTDIIEFIKNKLTAYMIPSVFKQVESIPVSISGKADRKSLLSLLDNLNGAISTGSTDITQKGGRVIDNNQNIHKIEKFLIEIWGKLLKRNDFSLTAGFFELGGNSLLIMQLIMSFKKDFNLDIDVVSFMNHSSIKDFAKYLSSKEEVKKKFI
ncbi:MAG: non-ribosomal peptide synthetase [Bacteroidales bacterium]|nr:non-ribosomal peptide synthetase [Bacteroidales bacterium]